VITGVGVEKNPLLKKRPSPKDRKCPPKSRTPFIGHPDAILFSRILPEGLFQQTQAFILKPPPRDLSAGNVVFFAMLNSLLWIAAESLMPGQESYTLAIQLKNRDGRAHDVGVCRDLGSD
jgi:hypothetical protein